MRTLRLALVLFCLGLAPAWAQQAVVIPATMATVPITMSTATTTRLATGLAGKFIYVTQWNIIAAGTTNITWVTGTGTNCATNQTGLSGTYQLTAQVGLVVGTGYGAVLVVPVGQDLCLTNSQAIAIPGSLAYAIF
jgi:hypothetical protein